MTFKQHRMSALFVVGLAALLLAPVALADDWVAKWSNGHKIENSDKGHKLKFGGRIQADYQFADSDEFDVEDGFEFRRARLFFSGTVYNRIEFKAQYDFAGGDADFKDVWLGIKNDWGKIKFGHFKEHFSLEELTSSKYLTFLERSLPVQAFSPSRNSGVGFEGKNGDKFNWGVGWYYDADGFGVSTDEDNTNLTGRIAFRPYYEDGNLFHIGLGATFKDRASSIRFRARPENHIGGRLVDTKSFSASGADIFNFELATVAGPFWASAEYFSADVDSSANGDPSFDGAYVQAGWFLTGESRAFKTSSGAFNRIKPAANFGEGSGAWELKFRYSTIDLNDGTISGGEEDNISVGVNWYLNPVTRLMIDYVDADVDNKGDAQYFLVRWQVDF
ncbi:MAG: porin [Thermoanaerobaculia bacterium]|nr:porin [Thermoanaerobaculia bacterium]